jgi:hypothetical protein
MLLQLLQLDRGNFGIRDSSQSEFQCRDRISGLQRIYERFGRNHDSVRIHLLEIAETLLYEARHRILLDGDSDIQIVHVLLKKLSDVAKLYGPKEMSDDIILVSHILHGAGYSR